MKKQSIFDEIAATLPRPLQPGDSTVKGFAEEHGVSETTARKALEKFVKSGKLIRVRRTSNREGGGGGTTVFAYIEVK